MCTSVVVCTLKGNRQIRAVALVVALAVAGIAVQAEAIQITENGARVTLVTPWNGIASYRNVSQEYINEMAEKLKYSTPLSAGSAAVKAEVSTVRMGLKVVKTCTLVVGAAARSTLAGVAVQAGILGGLYCLDQYMAAHGNRVNPSTGVLEKPDPNTPGGYQPAPGSQGVGGAGVYSGWTYHVQGYQPSQAAAQQACLADYNSTSWFTCSGETSATPYYTQWGWNWTYWRAVGKSTKTGNQRYSIFYPVGGSQVVWQESPWVTMLRSEFESMLAGSLQAGDANAEKVANAAVGVLAPYLNKSNQYFPEVDPAPAGDPPAPGLTEAQMAEIQAALNAAITAADKSAVEQGDSPKEVGSGDWEYTPEQHAEAQYQKDKQLDGEQKADYQALDVQAAPPETAPGTPEKRSLTAVLDQFYGGAEQTAIYGKLQALKDVTYTNPSCSFVADLGDWGQVTFSMCEWQTSLNVLGSLMVMACGFLWVLWFFMGRGDT